MPDTFLGRQRTAGTVAVSFISAHSTPKLWQCQFLGKGHGGSHKLWSKNAEMKNTTTASFAAVPDYFPEFVSVDDDCATAVFLLK